VNPPPPEVSVRISVGKICVGVFLGIMMAAFFLFFLVQSPRVWNGHGAPSPEYFVIITRPVPVKMSYGNIILPGGVMLVLSRNAYYAGVVEARYQGEIVRIPIEATTLSEQW
jgi:hypothetical protein